MSTEQKSTTRHRAILSALVVEPEGQRRRTRVHRRVGGTAYTSFGTFVRDEHGTYRSIAFDGVVLQLPESEERTVKLEESETLTPSQAPQEHSIGRWRRDAGHAWIIPTHCHEDSQS